MIITKRCDNAIERWHSGIPEGASETEANTNRKKYQTWENQTLLYPLLGISCLSGKINLEKCEETWYLPVQWSLEKNMKETNNNIHLDSLYLFNIKSSVDHFILQCSFDNFFIQIHSYKKSFWCPTLKKQSLSKYICYYVSEKHCSICGSISLSQCIQVKFINNNKYCIACHAKVLERLVNNMLTINSPKDYPYFSWISITLKQILPLGLLTEAESRTLTELWLRSLCKLILGSVSELRLSQFSKKLIHDVLSALPNQPPSLNMVLTFALVLDENKNHLIVMIKETFQKGFGQKEMRHNCRDNQSCYCETEDHNFQWRVNRGSESNRRAKNEEIKLKYINIIFFYTFFLHCSMYEKLQLNLNYDNDIYLCQIEFDSCDNSVFTFILCFNVKSQSRIVYLGTDEGKLSCAKRKFIAKVEKNMIYLYLILLYHQLETVFFRNTSYSVVIITPISNNYRVVLHRETLLNINIANTTKVCCFMLLVCYAVYILLEISNNRKLKLSFTIVFNFISCLVCDWAITLRMLTYQQVLVFFCNSKISKVLSLKLNKTKISTNKFKNYIIIIKVNYINYQITLDEINESVEMYHIVFLFRSSYIMNSQDCYKTGCKNSNCENINFPGSKLYICAFAKTNNRRTKLKKSLYVTDCCCIQQHAISTKRSKSNYTNIDITGKEDNSVPSKGKTSERKILKSSLQNLTAEISFPFLFYYHCVNITFNERPEFRGQFPQTIKHRRRGKTKERAIRDKRDKFSLKLDGTKLAIKKTEESMEKRSRKFKEHSKHGGTILSIRLPLFLALFCYLIAGGSASCPRLCSCKWKGGKQTVECINKGLTTIPSDIDPGTQVLDMTGNPLVIISREKFKIIGLTNLQRIYATRCKLVQLDDSAFRGLSNLVELDLSINELRVVPAATLQFLPSLMRLQLSFNPITHIKDGSFRGLAYLTSLELTGCAIHTLESLAFQGLDRLEWLKINDNNLTTVPPKMMLPKSLHGVDMHNNPWTCDCKLRQLRQWLVQYNVPSSIEPKCAGPMRLRNRIIKEVIPSDLACAPDMRPTSLFLDIIEGKNVSFECHVAAVPDAEVQWLFNGYPLENSTFAYEDATSLYVYEDKELEENKISYLRIETVTEAHSGIFQCVAENQAGRTISNFTLRVSLPPTKPAPSVPPMNHIVYIGTALISLVVLVIILFCILVIRCCRRRSKHVKNNSNSSIVTREKQLSSDRPKSNNMPKYIQMGTPAPKINGILADTPPISVIENSPYRTEPVGSTHINPDIIADGPDDRTINKPAKKKVSIVGVEEMDANGTIITRKLDDIIEESEDNFDPTYEKIQVRNGYENTQSLLNNHYATLTRQPMDSGTNNQYPLTEMPPDQVPQQNVRFYDQQGFSVDYIIPREQWQNGTGRMEHIIRYSSPVPSDQSPLYATIKRNREEVGVHSNLLHDQKYPEEYSLQECNPHFTAPDMRYQQNYGLVSAHKKVCEGGNTFCECCQPTTSNNSAPSDYNSLEPLGRMRGDGCSFDHLLSSCGGQCCYDEKTGQLFDNTLPENYRPLEENPPPPPEGYGDSEDEVDIAKTQEWGDCTLSPGTRVLYSPQEEQFTATRDEQQPIIGGITNV